MHLCKCGCRRVVKRAEGQFATAGCWYAYRHATAEEENAAQEAALLNGTDLAPAPTVPMPVGRAWNDERNKKRIGFSPIRICVFDIETTDLYAGMGRVLCYSRKQFDPVENKVIRADEFAPWKEGRRSDDSQVVAAILADLEEYDVWIGHNAQDFDVKFLRSRALVQGLPPVQPVKLIDPVRIARNLLRFRSNSLDSLSQMLGLIERKTPVDMQTWARASMDGDKEAMDYIVEHCVKDVDVLDEMVWYLRKYVKQIDVLGSFRV